MSDPREDGEDLDLKWLERWFASEAPQGYSGESGAMRAYRLEIRARMDSILSRLRATPTTEQTGSLLDLMKATARDGWVPDAELLLPEEAAAVAIGFFSGRAIARHAGQKASPQPDAKPSPQLVEE